MLSNTFIHIKGIDIKTERKLWRQNILTWDDLIERLTQVELAVGIKERAAVVISQSKAYLQDLKPEYFSMALPRSEIWRCYWEFKDSAAFIDVETDGTWGAEAITLIGIYDREEYRPFMKGDNLLESEVELSRYALWVTYSGTGFDLPLIYKLFPSLTNRHLHIDMMYPLRRLGLKGGLKAVERALSIERSDQTRGLSGWDAVRLWEEYRNGIQESRDLLIKYNREDCVNLEPLIEFAYLKLRQQTFDRYCLSNKTIKGYQPLKRRLDDTG